MYGIRNESRDAIVDFILDFTTYDLILTNAWFKKKDSLSITSKSERNISQTNYFLPQKVDSRYGKVCKETLGESVTTQHKLVVLDICIRRWKIRDISQRE